MARAFAHGTSALVPGAAKAWLRICSWEARVRNIAPALAAAF